MRVLVAGYGSTGDTQPLLALAVALSRAGHDVVLVTDEAAVEAASEHDLDCRVLAGSARSVVTEGSHGWSGYMETGRPSISLLMQLARLNTQPWIETIDDAAENADVIVATTLVIYHAASVAQRRRIPLVLGQLQPTIVTRDYAPPASGLVNTPEWLNRPLGHPIEFSAERAYRGAINKVRRRLSQPRLRLVWNELPILAAWSPTLVPPSADWDHPDVTVTGPWQLGHDWQPPDDLARFLAAGEAPVYVGFGSMAGFSDRARLRDVILEGLDGRRALLSAGWAELTDTALPENVHPLGWAPHEWLFPHCAAILHHCGAGTSHRAARSGVPSIPMPFLADQPFWADRLYRLGIATALLNPRTVTSADVRDALQLIEGGRLAPAAQDVAARLAHEPDGAQVAVERIGKVVKST